MKHTANERPLLGKRVLVTRARPQNADLCDGIQQLGGEAYEFPTIRIVDPLSYGPLDEAIRYLHRFQWIVFTSVNAVDYFFRRFADHARWDGSQMGNASIAANGPKTAAALEARGVPVALLPGEYRAEALLAALEKRVTRGEKILLPRANIARSVLAEGLRTLGCDVVDVDAYRTEIETSGAAAVARMLAASDIHMITFTSASTVNNFVQSLDATGQPWRHGIGRVSVACIGPLTAAAARQRGLATDIVAGDYTIEGLLAAIRQAV